MIAAQATMPINGDTILMHQVAIRNSNPIWMAAATEFQIKACRSVEAVGSDMLSSPVKYGCCVYCGYSITIGLIALPGHPDFC